MRYVDLLAALGLATRLELARAERAGACTLAFHGAFELTISTAPREGRVRLLAPLGTLDVTDERERARALGALLQIAAPRGTRHRAHFGFDPMHDRILLFKTLEPATDGDLAQAVLAVESFVRQGIELLHTLPSLWHPASRATPGHLASLPPSAFA